MPRTRKSRLVPRRRTADGTVRYYADLRGDFGGKIEALVAPGERLATTDEVLALDLLAKRLRELQEAKRNRVMLGTRRQASVANAVAEHLVSLAREGRIEREWIRETERHLTTFVEFLDLLRSASGAEQVHADPQLVNELGADREMETVGVGHIKAYRLWLAERPGGRKRASGALAPGTQRHYLNSLGSLFAAAIEDESYTRANPVHALRNKPVGDADEARWLEVWEGALLIESARTYPYHARAEPAGARLGRALEAAHGDDWRPFVERLRARGKATTRDRLLAYVAGGVIPGGTFLDAAADALRAAGADGVSADWLRRGDPDLPQHRPDPIIYPLLAGWLLTGCRESELLGMEVDDVAFRRGIVQVRRNQHRGGRLKTRGSARDVPLWPQLRDIWEEWMEERARRFPASFRLLFPSPRLAEREGREGPLTDLRKALDAVSGRVGFRAGDIRTKTLRHTYCSTRSQTQDRGAPIALATVYREMGHREASRTTERIYLHVQTVRHRAEVVEYRVEQHGDVQEMARRLRPLQVA